MNRILTASVALFALAGAAVAQEAPPIYSNAQSTEIQSTQPAIMHDRGIVSQSATEGFEINASGDYSGR